nr:ALPV-168 [Albatrosspox virus]
MLFTIVFFSVIYIPLLNLHNNVANFSIVPSRNVAVYNI